MCGKRFIFYLDPLNFIFSLFEQLFFYDESRQIKYWLVNLDLHASILIIEIIF